MYPWVIACLTCRQKASRSQRRSTTSSTPVKVRWSEVKVEVVSRRCAWRTRSRSSPGISQSVGISTAASEVSPCISGWFATLEGTSKTRHSCAAPTLPSPASGGGESWRGDGGLNLEGRTVAGLALDVHPAAMAFEHPPDQVENHPS